MQGFFSHFYFSKTMHVQRFMCSEFVQKKVSVVFVCGEFWMHFYATVMLFANKQAFIFLAFCANDKKITLTHYLRVRGFVVVVKFLKTKKIIFEKKNLCCVSVWTWELCCVDPPPRRQTAGLGVLHLCGSESRRSRWTRPGQPIWLWGHGPSPLCHRLLGGWSVYWCR